MLLVLIGVAMLAFFYLAACHARWLVARHAGQGWRFMDHWDFLEAWDHLRYLGGRRCLACKIVVIVIACCMAFCICNGVHLVLKEWGSN